jgi:hypothetical protein
MKKRLAGLCCCILSGAAMAAEQPATVADLNALAPELLNAEQVASLMRGAKVTRINANGNLHHWTNEPDGTLVVSTDNKATTGQPSTARGTWTVDPEGKFCVVIAWRGVNDEKWCRLVFRTAQGHYLANANKKGTEKVHRFEIGR